MTDKNSIKKYSLEEIRKKYPKAGMKWKKQEDELLKNLYEEHRKTEPRDFDLFLKKLIGDFGRAAGGLKARLAMHFKDVPGWDYEGQKERDEFRRQQKAVGVEKQSNQQIDTVLVNEYQKYLTVKKETFRKFTLRLSHLFERPRGFIRARIYQLIKEVEEYQKDDILFGSNKPQKEKAESDISDLDFSGNLEFQVALELMEQNNKNVFLTGEAGTGKSTLLKYFRYTTKKNVAVLAPTGVAALNVEGQTIHSFCGFGPDITVHSVKKLRPSSGKFELLQKLQTIVIDEISMVRADLLDCLDKFLRINGPAPKEPFGGIQMVFIGDLHQLPPVSDERRFGQSDGSVSIPAKRVLGGDKDFGNKSALVQEYQSPYFFDSRSFKSSKFNYICLKTVYRQKEQVFLELLNAVRNNVVSHEHLTVLNQRWESGGGKFVFEQFAIYLTPTNARAQRVNNYFLEKINAPLKVFQGVARGSFEDRELPTDLELQVKVGAQVMMLNNDQKKRWVNGTMGRVVGIKKADVEAGDGQLDSSYVSNTSYLSYKFPDDATDGSNRPVQSDIVIVELETGETVYVTPHTWEMFKFVLDKHTQKVDSQTTGTYTQYPFKLAWAVTIHKAQGKTFDKVYIDLASGTFAHGQLYVALSRCRTLQGLYLKRPIVKEDIILDTRIVNFLNSFSKNEN